MTLPSQATSPRPPSTSAASSRRKIQVTGTSVTPAAGKRERHPCYLFLNLIAKTVAVYKYAYRSVVLFCNTTGS